MAIADFFRPVGRFRDVRVFESSIMGHAYNSAGIALPGYGMIVAPGAFSEACDMTTVYHEYGHFIQARLIGWIAFYLFVGIPSLISAWTRGFGRGHQKFWTERWCNYLVNQHIPDAHLEARSYPASDISARSKWLMGLSK